MNRLLSSFERQDQIIQFLQRSQRISIEEICRRFTISEATARRDLEALGTEGKVRRVHGGAIALAQTPPEAPILQRQNEQPDEKQRIGEAAAEIVQDGETVFLGSGTTVLAVARALRARQNLTVITNSLPVVNVFAGADGITVICLGGMLRPSELSFIGHITEQSLAEVHADKVFIGVRGVSLDFGLTNEYLPETMTDRAILHAGRELIVVVDHTKFERTATVLLSPLDQVQTIVTDGPLPAELSATLKERQIRIIEA